MIVIVIVVIVIVSVVIVVVVLACGFWFLVCGLFFVARYSRCAVIELLVVLLMCDVIELLVSGGKRQLHWCSTCLLRIIANRCVGA